MLGVCIIRLADMQLREKSYYNKKIEQLKSQWQDYQQTQTVRGDILDCRGRVLATDQPEFKISISYELLKFMDERVRRGKLLKADRREDRAVIYPELKEEISTEFQKLETIIEKLSRFGQSKQKITSRINSINESIWNLRGFLAWARNNPDTEIIKKYGSITSVPVSVAFDELEKKFPNETKRLTKILEIDDLADMYEDFPILTLKNQDDIFTAQIEFMQNEEVQISPSSKRSYPYGEAASQAIGWVGSATQPKDTELFEGDKLSRYLEGEICGREDGTEYVCESILRGRRGELLYDIDEKLVTLTERNFGRDVQLTIDIELQREIEQVLNVKPENIEKFRPKSAVVIDISTGKILVLASVPGFEPAEVRSRYGELINDANRPMTNRAINKLYPPGSVVKPLIAAGGLQEEVISPTESIECLAQKAPKGWPSCWIVRHGQGHTSKWAAEGGNNARNAIKGSCNIYFSRLADKINPRTLQRYLWMFGYGRSLIFPLEGIERNFRQADGIISSELPEEKIKSFNDVGFLDTSERRWFGIGQGNLRVTPIQVAVSMGTIARDGYFKQPVLFAEQVNESNGVNLGLSQEILNIVKDGLYAVVNEYGGTAYNEFRPNDFEKNGIKVHGKTGSTEAPENAWFAGFAEYERARGVAFAVIVERGESGAHDAAPLGKKIVEICQRRGYLEQ